MSEEAWGRHVRATAAALVWLGLAAAPVSAGRALEPSGRPPQDPGCGVAGSGPSMRGWYRLEERTDPRGALVGWRLEVGTGDGPVVAGFELPVESSAAGPFGSQVLVTSDDGAGSTISSVDAATGCVRVLHRDDRVVRRATLDAPRKQLYFFAVERGSRRDLGVWRHSLGDRGTRGVLPPLKFGPAEAPFGPTFTTELHWSSDGTRLAVDSCGALHCRTRLLDVPTGGVRVFGRPGAGPLIGVSRGALVSYAACPGLPCPVLATRLADGVRAVLVPAAGAAELSDGETERLVFEIVTHRGRQLRSVALPGSPSVRGRDGSSSGSTVDRAMGRAVR